MSTQAGVLCPECFESIPSTALFCMHCGTKMPARRQRDPLPAKLRFEILKRDGYTCVYCGRRAPEVQLHVDHVTPVSLGGRNDPANLVAACADCNLGKGATPASNDRQLHTWMKQDTELSPSARRALADLLDTTSQEIHAWTLLLEFKASVDMGWSLVEEDDCQLVSLAHQFHNGDLVLMNEMDDAYQQLTRHTRRMSVRRLNLNATALCYALLVHRSFDLVKRHQDQACRLDESAVQAIARKAAMTAQSYHTRWCASLDKHFAEIDRFRRKYQTDDHSRFLGALSPRETREAAAMTSWGLDLDPPQLEIKGRVEHYWVTSSLNRAWSVFVRYREIVADLETYRTSIRTEGLP